MKKVAIVWSSPNTDGLTASAKDRIMNGLAEAGVTPSALTAGSGSV